MPANDQTYKICLDSRRSPYWLAINYSNSDIPLNTVFTSAYVEKSERIYPQNIDSEWQHQIVSEIEAIQLKLESVQKFKNPFNCLPKGYSAGVILNGSGDTTVYEMLVNAGVSEHVILESSNGET